MFGITSIAKHLVRPLNLHSPCILQDMWFIHASIWRIMNFNKPCIWKWHVAFHRTSINYSIVLIQYNGLTYFILQTDVRKWVCQNAVPRFNNLNYCIALKLGRHIGGSATDVPAKFLERLDNFIQITRLRYFTRSYNNTSYRILEGGGGASFRNKAKQIR